MLASLSCQGCELHQAQPGSLSGSERTERRAEPVRVRERGENRGPDHPVPQRPGRQRRRRRLALAPAPRSLDELVILRVIKPAEPPHRLVKHGIAESTRVWMFKNGFAEQLEFIATLAHHGAHAGGYWNTGWDLIANFTGATAAGIVLARPKAGAA